MAGGFGVSPGALLAGRRELVRLRDGVDQAGSDIAAALVGAAGACGDGRVRSALNVFVRTAMQRYLDAMAGCQVTGDRLAQTAAHYQQADGQVVQRLLGVGP